MTKIYILWVTGAVLWRGSVWKRNENWSQHCGSRIGMCKHLKVKDTHEGCVEGCSELWTQSVSIHLTARRNKLDIRIKSKWFVKFTFWDLLLSLNINTVGRPVGTWPRHRRFSINLISQSVTEGNFYLRWSNKKYLWTDPQVDPRVTTSLKGNSPFVEIANVQ